MSDSPRDWREFLQGTHARIDLDAYARNISLLREMAPRLELMAIVKANAYGHGAVACAHAATLAGATFLGVARVDEALNLRRHEVIGPILVLGPPNLGEVKRAVEADVALAVGSETSLDAVLAAAAEPDHVVVVHVKVDSGMHRYGFAAPQIPHVFERLHQARNVNVDGLFTHFARADERDPGPSDEQERIFHAVVDDLRSRDLLPPWVHQANSAAILTGRHHGTNLVRGGIATFGLSPSDAVRVDERFRPILSLHSTVGRRFELNAGESVSYGGTYTAGEREAVATIPVGYADGLPRQLASRGWFAAGGERAPIRGRVCMDQTIVAVDADVSESDPVTVYGGEVAMSLEDIGSISGTNNYEIATRLMPRVPRLYYRGGEPVMWELPLLAQRGDCR